MKSVEVLYFAILREQRGLDKETLQTSARTGEELYQELRESYPFSLPITHIKIAVNGEFAEPTKELRSGDSIVFIPPVAGG